jgi:hypothetical protein
MQATILKVSIAAAAIWYRRYDGRWWYWTTENRWLYWNESEWVASGG